MAPFSVKFRGALYHLAIQVGNGSAGMTRDEVAELLAQQYHNRGRISTDKLKSQWVASPRFTLTQVYPALSILGTAAGKTGETYSMGEPLVIDQDLRQIAVHNPDGSWPNYLVLDGQNRLVRLRREAPYRLYPAYVGVSILEDVERSTKLLAERLRRKKVGPAALL
jgi:hypothetical protein